MTMCYYHELEQFELAINWKITQDQPDKLWSKPFQHNLHKCNKQDLHPGSSDTT